MIYPTPEGLPLLARRGGCDSKKKGAKHFSCADGVVVQAPQIEWRPNSGFLQALSEYLRFYRIFYPAKRGLSSRILNHHPVSASWPGGAIPRLSQVCYYR